MSELDGPESSIASPVLKSRGGGAAFRDSPGESEGGKGGSGSWSKCPSHFSSNLKDGEGGLLDHLGGGDRSRA